MPDRKPTLEEICEALTLTDAEGFLRDLQHILIQVYQVNVDRHDEGFGDDAITFGTLIYRNSWAQIQHHLPRLHADVRVERPEGSLTIYTGGPELKVYKGGSGPRFEIEEYNPDSGSVTKRKTVERNERQLSLFSASDYISGRVDAGLAAPVWFVVHYGNPQEGFLGMGIGAPLQSSVEDPQWLFTFLLPDLQGDTGDVSVARSPNTPSYDQIPEPVIRIDPISKDAE